MVKRNGIYHKKSNLIESSHRREFGHVGQFCCLVALFLSLCSSAQAAAINAKSLALTDVTAAINLAAPGDTVMLPAGNATWTVAVTVNKGISIIGAGKDVTVITASIAGRTNRRTFTIVASAGQPMFRLSGLTIKGVTGEGGGVDGVVSITGNAHQFRIDNVRFGNANEHYIKCDGYLWGVIDHCVFDTISQSQTAAFHIGHNAWPNPDGTAGINGNGSWADDPYWGTEKFIFIEDCDINGSTLVAVDGDDGARVVFRHNRSVARMGIHGTESGQIHRGGRTAEIYKNTFDRSLATNTQNDMPVRVRSGSRLIWGNTFIGWNNNSANAYYRGHDDIFQPWGGSDGVNLWDNNDPTIYESGTANAASSGLSVVLNLSGVAKDQYKNYVLRNRSAASPSTSERFSTITGNEASSGGTTKVYYMGVAGYANTSALAFLGGDRFEIRKVLAGLDAPGRGKGDLLAGTTTTMHNTRTGGPDWPRNALEGIWFWDNHNSTPTGPLAIYAYYGIPAMDAGLYTDASGKPGYTPYIYPHPLAQSGSSTVLSPPQNLRVVPGG
jgi:hypothetical protein